jgi:ubiquinone/menaquinone biosynthesis C-methylase UbiE
MPGETPGAAASAPHSRDYVLGSSEHERKRLTSQAAFLREATEAAFRAAGILPGMRVLDIGSGAGDVAMLAADLVGPGGSVVGLDRDPANVAFAIKRVAEASRTNIRFHVTEFDAYADSQPFDALVGRYILMYVPDPVSTLRNLSRLLRSGAAVAFFEPDFSVPSRGVPEIPLVRQVEQWNAEVFRRSGARMDMGMQLYRVFREVGFVDSGCSAFHLSGCGINREMVDLFVAGVRSVLPKIQEYGIATAEEVGIDTLADRLYTAAAEADPQWVSTRSIATWARKP